MLYNEDYRVLNLEDENQLKKAEALITKIDNVNMISSVDLLKYDQMHPRAAYFYKSIFPNNYLYIGDLKDKDLLKTLHAGFFNLLSESGVTERDVLKYIKDNKAYCIIGSICQNFDFGHHDMYLFKEFRLSTNYISDYLVVGKNSHGYHFIFVEVEKPKGEITTKNGEFGTTIRRGIKQIDDWDEWIEANFHSLRLEF